MIRASMARLAMAALAVAATVTASPAQVVGTAPEKSPYSDLDDGHRIGVMAGWLSAGRDPVGVGPKGGPLLGVRYDALMGGPAYFTGRLFTIVTSHDELDPNRPNGQRKIGTKPSNLLAVDAGVTVSLTGERTWHSIQPLVHAGIGAIGGVGNSADIGGYRPSLSTLLSWGFGVRRSTGQNAELRADFSWLYFKVAYPESYRTTTATDNIPLRGEGSMSPGVGNRSITLTWSWGVFR